MHSESSIYPYRLRRSFAVLMLAGAAGFIYLAYDRFLSGHGLIFRPFFTLDPSGARIFWVFVGLTGLLLLGATLRLIYLNLTMERAVVLGPRAITLPSHRFKSSEVTIAYRDILSLRLKRYRSQQLFTIRTRDRKILVQSVFMPSNDSFAELYEELGMRIQRAGIGRG